jgi:hypothetical protein
MAVEPREATRDAVSAVRKRDAGDDHKQVAPNSVSIAQAHSRPPRATRGARRVAIRG